MPGTVTVATKLPHGLILRVFTMVDQDEPVMGGGFRTVKTAKQLPKQVVLNGAAHPQDQAPTCLMVGGWALTPNVDKDLWDLWLEQNKDSDVVRNGLIFAHEKAGNAEAESKDKAKLKSGLERLDPDNLPMKRIKKADAAARH